MFLIALIKDLCLCADILTMISSVLAAMAGYNSAPYVLLVCVPLSLLYGRLVEILDRVEADGK